MSRLDVNERVNVTAMGFRKNLATYPKRMEFRGATYNFIDAGLHCLVRNGGIVAEIFTLSDGFRDYFLKSDGSGNDWILLGIGS